MLKNNENKTFSVKLLIRAARTKKKNNNFRIIQIYLSSYLDMSKNESCFKKKIWTNWNNLYILK